MTLYDIFKIDLKNIPDKTFNKENNEVNSIGSLLQNFSKHLDYLECNLFDIIEIKYFDENSKNVLLRNYNLKAISVDTVKQFVTTLVSILGVDDKGLGQLTSEDEKYFFSKDLYTLFGRNWTDPYKHKMPIYFGIDRDQNFVSLTIWNP
ncbi:MAG TPA: hypothetical protein VHZ50_08385 [Puia sp.]|jgi:hypothetical protein|nr:hypothetical protein [Puia sp.]